MAARRPSYFAPAMDAAVWKALMRGVRGKQDWAANQNRALQEQFLRNFDGNQCQGQRMYGAIGGNTLLARGRSATNAEAEAPVPGSDMYGGGRWSRHNARKPVHGLMEDNLDDDDRPVPRGTPVHIVRTGLCLDGTPAYYDVETMAHGDHGNRRVPLVDPDGIDRIPPLEKREKPPHYRSRPSPAPATSGSSLLFPRILHGRSLIGGPTVSAQARALIPARIARLRAEAAARAARGVPGAAGPPGPGGPGAPAGMSKTGAPAAAAAAPGDEPPAVSALGNSAVIQKVRALTEQIRLARTSGDAGATDSVKAARTLYALMVNEAWSMSLSDLQEASHLVEASFSSAYKGAKLDVVRAHEMVDFVLGLKQKNVPPPAIRQAAVALGQQLTGRTPAQVAQARSDMEARVAPAAAAAPFPLHRGRPRRRPATEDEFETADEAGESTGTEGAPLPDAAAVAAESDSDMTKAQREAAQRAARALARAGKKGSGLYGGALADGVQDFRDDPEFHHMVGDELRKMGFDDFDDSEVQQTLGDDDFYSQAMQEAQPEAFEGDDGEAAEVPGYFDGQGEDGYADAGVAQEAAVANEALAGEPEQPDDGFDTDAYDTYNAPGEGMFEDEAEHGAVDDQAALAEDYPEAAELPAYEDQEQVEADGQEAPEPEAEPEAEPEYAENLDAEAQALDPEVSLTQPEQEGEEFVHGEMGAPELGPFTGAEGEGDPALAHAETEELEQGPEEDMQPGGEASEPALEPDATEPNPDLAAASDAATGEVPADADAEPPEEDKTALLDAIDEAVGAASSDAERKALVEALGHPAIALSGDDGAKSDRTKEAVAAACDAALKRGIPVEALTHALHGSGFFSSFTNGIKRGVQKVAQYAKPVLGVARLYPGMAGRVAGAAHMALNAFGGPEDDEMGMGGHGGRMPPGTGGMLHRVGRAAVHRSGAVATGNPADQGLYGGSRKSAYVATLIADQHKNPHEQVLGAFGFPKQASRNLKNLQAYYSRTWDKAPPPKPKARTAAEEEDDERFNPDRLGKDVGDAPPATAPAYMPEAIRAAWPRWSDTKKRAILRHYQDGDKAGIRTARGGALWHAKLAHIAGLSPAQLASSSGSGLKRRARKRLRGGGFSRNDNVIYKGPPAAWVPADGVLVVVKEMPGGKVLVEDPDTAVRQVVLADHLQLLEDEEEEAAPAPAPAAAAAAPAPALAALRPPRATMPRDPRSGVPLRKAPAAPYADRSAGIAMAGQKRGRGLCA